MASNTGELSMEIEDVAVKVMAVLDDLEAAISAKVIANFQAALMGAGMREVQAGTAAEALKAWRQRTETAIRQAHGCLGEAQRTVNLATQRATNHGSATLPLG